MTRRHALNRLLSTGLWAATLATCLIATPIPARAEGSNTQTPGSGSAGERSIEGTWLSQVTTGNPPTTFYSFATFLPGGHIIEESSSPPLRTVGQGEWSRIGPRQFLRSVFIIDFVSPRTFSGMHKVTNMIRLNEAGDEFDADAVVEYYDTNGNPTRVVYNTSHARRCEVEMTIPQCMGISK